MQNAIPITQPEQPDSIIGDTRNKDDVRNWGSDIYSGEK